MCRYPSSSAARTASTHSGPSGTCQTPSPSRGISLPSASVRAVPSPVTRFVVITSPRGYERAGRDGRSPSRPALGLRRDLREHCVDPREAVLRALLDAVLHCRVALLGRREAHRLRQLRLVTEIFELE